MPQYYIAQDIHSNPLWKSVLSDTLATTLSSVIGLPGQSVALQFIGGAATSLATSNVINEAYIEIKAVDEDRGYIGDFIHL